MFVLIRFGDYLRISKLKKKKQKKKVSKMYESLLKVQIW